MMMFSGNINDHEPFLIIMAQSGIFLLLILTLPILFFPHTDQDIIIALSKILY